MTVDLLPQSIRENYEIHEWRHACAVLSEDFPIQLAEIIDVLNRFKLRRSDIQKAGGRKSPISEWIDTSLYNKGWKERKFDTAVKIDSSELETPTHAIDCVKGRVGLEIEWNNKDPFYDRDLNNFRLLFDLRVISVGVIITRCSHLQKIFKDLGKGSSYGASTTHMEKLLPRIYGGGGGGCPLLVFGISNNLYVED